MSDVSVISKRKERYYVRGKETLQSKFIYAIDIEMPYATYDVNVIGPKQVLDLAAKRSPGPFDILKELKWNWRGKYVFFCLLINKISN